LELVGATDDRNGRGAVLRRDHLPREGDAAETGECRDAFDLLRGGTRVEDGAGVVADRLALLLAELISGRNEQILEVDAVALVRLALRRGVVGLGDRRQGRQYERQIRRRLRD